MKKHKIIFVCTGNTCRSVIAEMLFGKMLSDAAEKNPEKRDFLDSIEASSAGIAPFPGMSPASGTLRVLRDAGIDASTHRARKLSAGDVSEASLIIVMENRQKKEAAGIAGCCGEKIRHINEFSVNSGKDIADPFGHNIEVYNECAEEIKSALEKLIEKIHKGELF